MIESNYGWIHFSLLVTCIMLSDENPVITLLDILYWNSNFFFSIYLDQMCTLRNRIVWLLFCLSDNQLYHIADYIKTLQKRKT